MMNWLKKLFNRGVPRWSKADLQAEVQRLEREKSVLMGQASIARYTADVAQRRCETVVCKCEKLQNEVEAERSKNEKLRLKLDKQARHIEELEMKVKLAKTRCVLP